MLYSFSALKIENLPFYVYERRVRLATKSELWKLVSLHPTVNEVLTTCIDTVYLKIYYVDAKFA